MLRQFVTWISRLPLARSRVGGFFSALFPGRQGDDLDKLGPAGEKEAAKFLKRLGYKIIQRNHLQRRGEIDIVAVDGETIVFVEVKTWRSNRVADPSEAVDRKKQRLLTRAALIFLKRKGLLEHRSRFDVLSIVWSHEDQAQGAAPTIRHFKHAFEAVDF